MRYSGAGIIPIVNINGVQHLVVFESNKGLLTDAGGRIDYNESPIDAAVRELYEESSSLKQKHFNIPCGKTVYKIYFAEIKQLPNKEQFLQLRESYKLAGNYHYTENKSITFITVPEYLSDTIVDIYGTRFTLHQRLKKILKYYKQ
jgi:hypothetical protein